MKQPVISTRIDPQEVEHIDRLAALRQHNRSEALVQIIKYGTPVYEKKVAPVFQPVQAQEKTA